MSTPGTPTPLSPHTVSADVQEISQTQGSLLFCGNLNASLAKQLSQGGYLVHQASNAQEALSYLRAVGLGTRPKPDYLIVAYSSAVYQQWESVLEARIVDPLMRNIPLLLLGTGPGGSRREISSSRQAIEVFDETYSASALLKRLKFLREEDQYLGVQAPDEEASEKYYQIPRVKRIFDIVVSSGLLLVASPIMLLVILLIRLESKGPILYISKRVGTGYKVFNFLKFRSMRVNADKELDSIKHLNQYGNDTEAMIADEEEPSVDWNSLLQDDMNESEWMVADDETMTEAKLQAKRDQELKSSFVKVQNDPRITRVGKFIRNTSLDELPQLINVLRGDMSIVGNRPLPLYEAEKLTSDAWTLRFLAPAGITGWWQVKERGKSDVSEREFRVLPTVYQRFM